MFSISLLCPTRKRTESLERMWLSALQTAKFPKKLELVLYIDSEDLKSRLKADEFIGKYGNQINLTISGNKKEIYSNLHNICCEKVSSDIIFSAADDLIFRTKDWDSLALGFFDLYKDKILYLYPDDGHWGQEFGTHGFFHRKWFDTLGYLSPPIFDVGFSDNYIMDVSRGVDRCAYTPDILIEHMHWTFGKSEFDDTAQQAHKKRLEIDNEKIYESPETIRMKQDDISKLMKVINE